MGTLRHRLAVSLNWLAVFWLVGWVMFVNYRNNTVPTMRGTMLELAALLIPAAIAFGISWFMDRYDAPDRSDGRDASPN